MTPAAQPPPASKYTFKNLSCAKWNNQPDMAALVVSPQPDVDNKAMPNSSESTMALASGFPAVGEADWLALLRKSAPGKTGGDLATESDDGISVGPFYIPDTSGEI